MASLTHHWLVQQLARRQQQQLVALMQSRPCYVERLGLQALCHKFTVDTGDYNAVSASEHITVDIASLHGLVRSNAWQIDITTRELYAISPQDETIYEYTTLTYVLLPDVASINRTTTIVRRSTQQTVRDDDMVYCEETALDYLDAGHHAFIRSALEQTGCIVASKLH